MGDAERAGAVESEIRRHWRRWFAIAVVVVVVAAGLTGLVAWGAFGTGRSGTGPTHNGLAVSTAPVERRSLSTQHQLNGTLGYAGAYTVASQAPGTVTWLPDVGQVITNGQVLYRVDNKPVVLLNGPVPAYRALVSGATAADVTGPDVAELNHDLVALGYVDSAAVESAWDRFNWATRAGVKKLQSLLGMDQTGKLNLGDAVFLPTAARVTTLQANLSGPAPGPVLTATSTSRTVSVALSADLQADVHQGDTVTITLPDGTTTPGTVPSVGTVASVPSGAAGSGGPGGSGGGPTVAVTIQPTDPSATGRLDQAPVLVTVTDRTVSDVLAVRVDALLAQAGGYAVEVVADDGTRHLVPVTPGLFDDAAGMVQVSGAGLAVAQRVVVPSNA
jgi:Putative peptidoglycan binding domain